MSIYGQGHFLETHSIEYLCQLNLKFPLICTLEMNNVYRMLTQCY